MDSLSIFFIVTAILSMILAIYCIYSTRKQKLSLIFAIGGLLGSITGYAIKYIPTIWEKPYDRPTPPYERFIVVNLSYGEWLMVLIITLICLSILKLYEEKQAITAQSKAETRADIEAESEGMEEGKQ
jgi:L-cystine uptake protein TcyP (sodium:dicarboxylate symporter family)